MLVYRGMDVGTAKPTPADRERVPHHLIDLAEPSERFTVSRFQEEAATVLADGGSPLLVGGSGLYFRAVVDGLVFPPEDPVVRSALQAEADELGSDGPLRAARRRRPGRRGEDRSGERPPDHPRARGHRDHRRAVQRLRGGVGDLRPVPRAGRGDADRRARRSRRASAGGWARCSTPAGSTRSGRSSPAGSARGSPRRRRSATRRSRSTSPVSSSSMRRWSGR